MTQAYKWQPPIYWCHHSIALSTRSRSLLFLRIPLGNRRRLTKMHAAWHLLLFQLLQPYEWLTRFGLAISSLARRHTTAVLQPLIYHHIFYMTLNKNNSCHKCIYLYLIYKLRISYYHLSEPSWIRTSDELLKRQSHQASMVLVPTSFRRFRW